LHDRTFVSLLDRIHQQPHPHHVILIHMFLHLMSSIHISLWSRTLIVPPCFALDWFLFASNELSC
jgi:hypothetical protein